jgi:hypothetical protein
MDWEIPDERFYDTVDGMLIKMFNKSKGADVSLNVGAWSNKIALFFKGRILCYYSEWSDVFNLKLNIGVSWEIYAQERMRFTVKCLDKETRDNMKMLPLLIKITQ